jgi:hypothetical protein
MSFTKTITLTTIMVLTLFMLVCKGSKESNAVSKPDYEAACKEIPVGELTNNTKAYIGEKVKVTGNVVAFEEYSDQNDRVINTSLIVEVEDTSGTLPSGKLPVFISFDGATDAFGQEIVTVYGEFQGSDTPELQSIKTETLPRINAKFIIIEPGE